MYSIGSTDVCACTVLVKLVSEATGNKDGDTAHDIIADRALDAPKPAGNADWTRDSSA